MFHVRVCVRARARVHGGHRRGQLAAVLQKRSYSENEQIVVQGEPGDRLFLIESGEASTHPPPPWLPTTKTYQEGEVFGENNLIQDNPAEATVTAMSDRVVVYSLSRADFEAQLGSLVELQELQRLADPRTLLADFYKKGDRRGPAGTLAQKGLTPAPDSPTHWFAVYRPCSRDSIAKMLGRVGVGKGLNIKGKSAQKNRLSGFVPFLQIHDNAHKPLVEASPKDARTKIFYKNVMAREEALNAMTKVLREGTPLDIAIPQIFAIKDAEPQSFGLDVPEPLVKEAYIMRPDLTQTVGWETGRPSVPQYMDMNLHGVRGGSRPAVCLIQYDTADPMNPLGLLIAYQESTNASGLLNQVKPVCSDFDTFTIGSKGMRYDSTSPDQVDIISWQLERTEEVLAAAPNDSKSWTNHWLGVIGKEEARGYHPEIPPFGFGEATSTRLIEDVVKCTQSCGAVRHGAECFNFWFPQELDREYLVIWDGFGGLSPWKSFSEDGVRKWLKERAAEGYSFPLNPVWPVRDPGWYDVLRSQSSSEQVENLEKWYPPEAGIMAKIERIHSAFPNGFAPKPK